MNVRYSVTILYRDIDGKLQVFRQHELSETPIAYRTILARAWKGLAREVMGAEGPEDVELHGMIEDIRITRER